MKPETFMAVFSISVGMASLFLGGFSIWLAIHFNSGANRYQASEDAVEYFLGTDTPF